jgi:hypothetical protein
MSITFCESLPQIFEYPVDEYNSHNSISNNNNNNNSINLPKDDFTGKPGIVD